MKTDFSKIIGKITQKGGSNYYLILGMIGIIMLCVGNLGTDKEISKPNDKTSLQTYKYQLENELEVFLENIDGVGDVKVMVSFESGEENIYAQQEKSDNQTNTNSDEKKQSENSHNTTENEYIIIKNSGGESALIEKTLQPVIQGVAVVCEGADDIVVIAAVTNSISAVLNVPSHKICVTKMR